METVGGAHSKTELNSMQREQAAKEDGMRWTYLINILHLLRCEVRRDGSPTGEKGGRRLNGSHGGRMGP